MAVRHPDTLYRRFQREACEDASRAILIDALRRFPTLMATARYLEIDDRLLRQECHKLGVRWRDHLGKAMAPVETPAPSEEIPMPASEPGSLLDDPDEDLEDEDELDEDEVDEDGEADLEGED